MSHTNAIEFSADALAILCKPGVYMFVRDDRAVYIGASGDMIGRCLSRNHHKHKKFVYALENCSLVIFPCATIADARKLEEQLIFELKPILNERGGWKTFAERLGFANASTAATAYKRFYGNA